MPTTSSRRIEDTPGFAEQMAAIRASKLRKAGLTGKFARAECEIGRTVYGLVSAGRGAYLFGSVGSGKTYAAACCVRKFVDNGGRARLVTASKLLDEIRAGYREDGDPFVLERVQRIPLLALDDLGMEHWTDWAVEKLCAIVDERVKRELPTVFTSNYALGEVNRRLGGIEGMRMASRIAGSCERIEVAGQDRRLACLP